MEPKVKKPATTKKYIWIAENACGETASSLTSNSGRLTFATADFARRDAEVVLVDWWGEEGFEGSDLYIIDMKSGEHYDVEANAAFKYISKGAV